MPGTACQRAVRLRSLQKKRTSDKEGDDADNDIVRVVIKDTGCGIAEEHLSKVFDPFFSTKEDRDRTGLGLSVSYGIVQEHGGTINIESRVNGGTTVNVQFPRSAGKRAADNN